MEQLLGNQSLIKTRYTVYSWILITKKLSMSNKSTFATGPIADTIGSYVDNDIVDKILDGTVTHASSGLDPISVDDELEVFRCITYSTTIFHHVYG